MMMKRIITENRLKALGSDGSVLMVLGLSGLIRSWVYITDSEGRTATMITDFIGMGGLAAVWVVLSAITLLAVIIPILRRAALSAQVGVHAAMALSLGLLWLESGWAEIHAAGISYGVITLLIFWGVARTTLRPSEVLVPEKIAEEALRGDG